MDDRKRRHARSLTFRLSLWASVVIAVVAAAASIWSFTFAFQEANALQDAQLDEIASLIGSGQLIPNRDQVDEAVVRQADVRILIQPLGELPGPNASTIRPLPIPASTNDGFHTLEFDAAPWRVYVKTLPDKKRIAIAQHTSLRDEIAVDGALRTLIPLLILTPLLIALVILLVRAMMVPVTRLSQALDSQSGEPLSVLPVEGIAVEFQPFIRSVNEMLVRVSAMIQQQHRFVADAAHELRTPLTALSLQAENLHSLAVTAEAAERLAALKRGIQRAGQLTEQLLTLARAQAPTDGPRDSVCPAELAKRVVADLLPFAESKHIDLGFARLETMRCSCDEVALATVLRNLLDNSIRYTPENGAVDVSVYIEERTLFLAVCDNGPGIPLNERKKVLQPFYRITGHGEPGSGLGLAIVAETAARSGGTLSLKNAHPGLCVLYSEPIHSAPGLA